MTQANYESLTAWWTEHEQGMRDQAARDDDEEPFDEYTMTAQKMMFFLGAYVTLHVLNQAGIVDETQPPVKAMMDEISAVHLVFPEGDREDVQ